MLRHTGQKRTFKHDVRLAILLCLNAGFINGAGFLGFKILTTNVTGHAALLAVNVANSDFRMSGIAALWLLLFLLGAFFSGIIIAKVGREKAAAYTIPILVIICILLSVALLGSMYGQHILASAALAGSLLFGMGMQNSLVSMISGSVVRTTHLTGMFTDLGIDLSLVFSRQADAEVRNRIILRLTIIFFFLLGGIIGGVSFRYFSFYAFFAPVGIMFTALFYDYFRVKVIRTVRKV